MDIGAISKSFIEKLQGDSRVTLKRLNALKSEIKGFVDIIEQNQARRIQFESDNENLIKCVVDAMISFIRTIGSTAKYLQIIDESIYNFFTTLARFSLNLHKETDLSNIKSELMHIITIQVPQEKKSYLLIMSGLVQCKWFYNIFQTKLDQETLFILFENIITPYFEDINDTLVPKMLKFILHFIQNSPYILDEQYAFLIFQNIDRIILNRSECINDALNILNTLIPHFHVSITLKGIEAPPFQKSIIDYIISSKLVTKAQNFTPVRTYLYLWITAIQAFNQKIPQSICDQLTTQLIELWTISSIKSNFLEPPVIPYLRFDIEILKSFTVTDLSRIFATAYDRLNPFYDFMFILIAFAKYSPESIDIPTWRKLISKLPIQSSSLIDKKMYNIKFLFYKEILNYIDDVEIWNEVFDKTKSNMDTKEPEYFNFVCALISKQRISTKFAHKDQPYLWNIKPENYTEERVRCIQTMAYYYGFASQETRTECFQVILDVITKTIDNAIPEQIEDLVRLVCSTLQSHAADPKTIPVEECPLDKMISKFRIRLNGGKAIAQERSIFNQPENDKDDESSEDEPIISQHHFQKSQESSQVFTVDTKEVDIEFNKRRLKRKELKPTNTGSVSLCNFINTKLQRNMVTTLTNARIGKETDQNLIRLYISKYAPKIFLQSQYLDDLSKSFNDACNNIPEFIESSFNQYIIIMITVAKSFDEEMFQPFFEKIQGNFFKALNKYVERLIDRLNHAMSSMGITQSWARLSKIHNDNLFLNVCEIGEIVSYISRFVPEFVDDISSCILPLIKVTCNFPTLHLPFIKHILTIPVEQKMLEDIFITIKNALDKTLFTYVVPIEERENFVIETLTILSNSLMDMNELNDIFNSISKYTLTYRMKLTILEIARHHFCEAPSLFKFLWGKGDDYDPFYILSAEQNIRIDYIDAVIAVLSTDQLEGNEHNKIDTFDKMLLGSYESALDEPTEYICDAYTDIVTLSTIAAQIPELTVKCLVLLTNFFVSNSIDIFPKHALDILFQPLGSYKTMQQLIPLLVMPLFNRNIKWQDFPWRLFGNNKIEVFEIIAPFLYPLAIRSNDHHLIEFLAETFRIPINDLMNKYDSYLIPFLFASSLDTDDQQTANQAKEHYNTRIKAKENLTFDSPLPILELSTICPLQLLEPCYGQMLKFAKNQNFFDFHKFLIILYANTYNSKHTIVQSMRLDQFSMYCQFIIDFHKTDLDNNPWLYTDMLVFARHLLEFAAPRAVDKLINKIGQNFPDIILQKLKEKKTFHPSLRTVMHAFEEICLSVENSYKARFSDSDQEFKVRYLDLENEFKDRFFDLEQEFRRKIPDLLDAMLLVEPYYEKQIAERTFGNEFFRISATQKVNKRGIDFLLQQLSNVSLNDTSIFNRTKKLDILGTFKSPAAMKRAGMNAIYDFIKKEKYPPALQFYAELQLRNFDMYPSPMILQGITIKLVENYLQALNECVRDRDPNVAMAALEALRHTKYQEGIESQYENNETQSVYIAEYLRFNPLLNSPAIPTENDKMPWFCRTVIDMIKTVGSSISFYPAMQLAGLSESFAKRIFSTVFMSAVSPGYNYGWKEKFRIYFDNPTKYIEENTAILKALIDLKNYNFNELDPIRQFGQEFHINWMSIRIEFSMFSKIALELGDPYLAYFFAEFARETNDTEDSNFMEIFKRLGVNELMHDLNIQISSLSEIAELHAQENRFNRSLLLYDMDASDNDRHNRLPEILRTLHLDHLQLQSGWNSEALWRLQKWEIPSATLREMDAQSHSTQVFKIMQSFSSKNTSSVKSAINEYFSDFQMNEFNTVGENLSILLDACTIQWFHALQMPNESHLVRIFPKDYQNIYVKFLEKLTAFSKISYKSSESAQMLNGIFIANNGFLDPSSSRIKLPNISMAFFDSVVSTASELKEVESAQYFVRLLRNSMKISQPADFEQICVIAVDSPLRAVNLLKKHANDLKIDPSKSVTKAYVNNESAQVFNLKIDLTLAQWYAQTHFTQTKDIVSNLQNVIDMANQCNQIDILVDAHFTLATFAHNMQRESIQFFDSTEYTDIVQIIAKLQENAKAIQSSTTRQTTDLLTLQNDINIHKLHLNQEKEKFKMSIILAIENYLAAMKYSDKHNLESLYSVVSLWFNYSFPKSKSIIDDDNVGIIEILESYFDNIAPKKFLPLFYQLAARIKPFNQPNTPNSTYVAQFQEFLKKVVKCLVKENSNQTLPVLFALTQNNMMMVGKPVSGVVNYSQEKIDSIIDLINEIILEDEKFSENPIGMAKRWNDMKDLLEAYIKLANHQWTAIVPTDLTLKMHAPELLDMPRGKNLPIIIDSNYTEIEQFVNKISVLDGVNKPLKITAIGKNGRRYNQILKGKNDDLRQDAVVEQLFQLSSQILELCNPALKIRSYKVVPLTPSAGIIEFVEKSMSIGSYLVGEGKRAGAHKKYGRNGLSPEMIQKKFREASDIYHNEAYKNNPNKLKVLVDSYKELCEKFQPCMRFFFVEKFSNTGDWFKARMNYALQTATNSMVGYIFGIGDRHTGNILIDTTSGEIIHIDLGIAFEQGKMLKIREIVPFRMTPDIIDGFGHRGGSGVFRSACVETLSSLRHYSEYLLTVLDVFLNDPLYNWNVVPKKKKTDMLKGKANEEIFAPKTATSVIMRCRYKLEGKDTGENLSVEGQVAQLYNEATDPTKLAQMYCGWKPYM